MTATGKDNNRPREKPLKELLETELRFQALVEAMETGLVVEDSDRNIILINRAFCDFFTISASPETLIGTNCADAAEQTKNLLADPSHFPRRIKEIISKRKLVIGEVIHFASGKIFERDYIPVFAHDKSFVGHMWQYRDITTSRKTEDELRRNEELYRAIVETQKELICRFKPDTTLTFANKAYLDYFGITETDIGSLRYLDLVPEEERPGIQRHIQKLRAGKKPLTYEHRVRSGDKNRRAWQRWTDYPLLNEVGEITEFQSHGYDITEIKETLLELQAMKSFNESIVQNITEGIIISDLNGKVTFANPALLSMLGYTAEEFVGTHWTSVVPAEYHRMVKAADARRLKGQADRYELTFKHKNGVLLPFQVSGTPYHDHATGELAGTVAVLTDISEQKYTEEVLKTSEERIHLMTRNIKDVVLETDANGYYTYVSASGSAVLGYGQELIGQRTFDYIHPEDTEQVLLSFAEVAGSNKTARVEYRFRHPVRGYIWVEGTGGTYQNSSNETVVLVTVRDISERKIAEDELRHMSLHDQLTGIYNRHYFESELRRFADSREYPIAIIVADLDGLKLINDTLGHSAGDSQLFSCAKLLEKALRSSDILARVGGDEFALLLPRTTKEAADKLVFRIRHHLELYNQAQAGLPLSISIGLAVCDTGDSSLIETYRSADSAMYQDKLTRSKGARHAIIEFLLAFLNEHDQAAGKTIEQIREYCLKLGQALNLSDSSLANLDQLARVRDLGNITLAGQLLQKSGSLTENECELIRRHAEAGYSIATSSPELAGIADLVLKHHENFDGTGYPLGLKGNAIPIECRIVAVCAAYCAMVNPRPYAGTLTPEEARAELQRCAGKQFDPQVVKAFNRL
jgi:diguanylate cyclase (GGDEF)-like protein/PAS domain S-box-containing protein